MTEEFKPLVPYWYNVGEIVNGLEILEQTYMVDKNGWRHKAYIVKCTKCGYLYDRPKSENNLKKYGCEVCQGRKVVQGINDIATTTPWMIKYFKNQEDSKRFTYSSNKKLPMICPDCMKTEKNMAPGTLYRNGFGCKFCSDGISYPEKFIINLFDQLGITFITQLSKNNFEWCENYRYDFYIPHKNIIIEVHGRQHYNDAFNVKCETQQEIDKNKKDLAILNGVENYIELDCRESNKEWIIQSILNSNLSSILEIDFDNVDWNKIELNSLKSNIFIACKLWNENKEFTTEDIGKRLHLTSAAILKYLRKGTELGICDYNTETGKYRRDLKKIGKVAINAKKVFYNDKIYDSIKAFANDINQKESVVGRWISGKAIPRCEERKKYLTAHYATEEEIKKYPKYLYQE